LYKDVEAAFNQLCVIRDSDTGRSLQFRDPQEKTTDPTKIPPEYLFTYLQTIGEPIAEAELIEFLSTLLGNFPEGGKPEAVEAVNEEELTNALDAFLPSFLNAETFIQQILGMQPCELEVPELNPLDSDKLRLCHSTSSRDDDRSSTKTVVGGSSPLRAAVRRIQLGRIDYRPTMAALASWGSSRVAEVGR
uniref:USP domain-containing protein n=1 Tax=Echinostoma caproni TaxID=27848 RepID=A0A183AWW0_9TREM